MCSIEWPDLYLYPTHSKKVLPRFLSCLGQCDLCGRCGAFLFWFTMQLHLPGRLLPDQRRHIHLSGLGTLEQPYTYVHRWVTEMMSGLPESIKIVLKTKNVHCSDDWSDFFFCSGAVQQFKGSTSCLHAMSGPRSEQLWLNMLRAMWRRIWSDWWKHDEMFRPGKLESCTSCLPGYVIKSVIFSLSP